MSILTPLPPELPFHKRVFLNIPVLGWMARDILYGDPSNRAWAAVIVASAWLWCVAQFGLIVLIIPFVLAIPAAFWLWFEIMVSRHDARAEKAAKG
ncbi:hypothetical protein [Meridianimarinicoccus aquatilis]|uniref:Uncharacterized protein n=1 Tax=Meridianimarinicoccus aquatilis TaxID=2552766 RepID=A0A4R6AR78_9RHOB|nr:hypothetical protein [Fluviibacterium aquatile]QIE42738.1 hypothetical protein G5B39_12895 [Rhodobacteraceae bacterium SC52]TDL86105.1 hypothetical protein E2L05_14115 [Fluviibacterium aquatile]